MHQKIQAKDFNSGLIHNPLQLIQSRFASLMVSRIGNDPNGVIEVRNRGLTSFNKTEPIYLLDGMPIENFQGLHPGDIESIEILQDGASLALWGMRGSNGIISITTKKGQSGKPQLRYQTSFALEAIGKTPQMLDAEGFVRFGGSDYGARTDWWEEISRNSFSQTHHLSMSGSTENSSYYASIGYDNINGVIKRSGFERINGRFSFEQRALNDRLKIGLQIGATQNNRQHIPRDLFRYASSVNPTWPIRSESPQFEEYGGYFQLLLFNTYNPVSMLETIDIEERYSQLMAHAKAEFSITPELTISTQYGNQAEEVSSAFYVPSTSLYMSGPFTGGNTERAYSKKENQYFKTALSFDKNWKKLRLHANFLYDYQGIHSQGVSVYNRDFLSDEFMFNNLAAGQGNENGDARIQSSQGLVEFSRYGGNLSLEVGEKLYLAGTFMREGASNLGKNNKWGSFYGISTAYKLNEDIRIRASLSKTGNAPQEPYISSSIFSPTNIFYFNGGFREGYGLTQSGNPDLKWEENQEISFGLDFPRLLGGKLQANLDYYHTQSKDIIQFIPVSSFNTAGASYFSNEGGLSSSGLEFTLNYSLINRKKFSYRMSLTGSRYFNTKLTDYESGGSSFTYNGWIGGSCNFPVMRLEVGEAIGEIWGRQIIEENPIVNGEFNFVDGNGNGFQEDREDYIAIGNAFAKSYVGINHQLDWGRFKLSALFRAVLGHHLINHFHSFYSFPRSIVAHNILETGIEEQRGLDWGIPEYTSRDVENASFLRLEILQLAYNLPLRLTGDKQALEISFTAQNLLTISGYSGLNPDYRIEDILDRNQRIPFIGVNYSRGDPMVPGMDRRNSYPLSRVFVLGLKMNL
ncbi:MAG: SusC/RagA family TonB-linked outer membrane protein [Bacteroidia bacterium]|nr:SusC/RagA family TonB-linked outer membrane protein [Bacteroidia bacterium]